VAEASKARLRVDTHRPPLVADASRLDEAAGFAREEIEEFFDALDELSDSSEKTRVESHLRATKAIVALRLPVADMDDDGYDAANAFLSYFVEHRGGLVQADGEGFYDADELLVELE
jgi:hypothetical protein